MISYHTVLSRDVFCFSCVWSYTEIAQQRRTAMLGRQIACHDCQMFEQSSCQSHHQMMSIHCDSSRQQTVLEEWLTLAEHNYFDHGYHGS